MARKNKSKKNDDYFCIILTIGVLLLITASIFYWNKPSTLPKQHECYISKYDTVYAKVSSLNNEDYVTYDYVNVEYNNIGFNELHTVTFFSMYTKIENCGLFFISKKLIEQQGE